jgi:hypothetical protein
MLAKGDSQVKNQVVGKSATVAQFFFRKNRKIIHFVVYIRYPRFAFICEGKDLPWWTGLCRTMLNVGWDSFRKGVGLCELQ